MVRWFVCDEGEEEGGGVIREGGSKINEVNPNKFRVQNYGGLTQGSIRHKKY